MSGPKQFITVGNTRIPTEEFVKDREAILARLTEEKKDPGQMMNIAQNKFDKILEEVKNKEEDTIEKEEETPVTSVVKNEISDVETKELDVVQQEEKNDEVEEKVEEKVEKKSNAKWGKKK